MIYPAPKPAKREKPKREQKPRSPLARVGRKKLEQLGGVKPFTTFTRKADPSRPSSPTRPKRQAIKKKPRSASEANRIYGSSTARIHVTLPDDGLAAEWNGRVWLNPPYGDATKHWLARLAEHGTGTALIFARTETAAWHEHVWPHARGVLFLAGRVYFHRSDGSRAMFNAGAPSALVAYGEVDAQRLAGSALRSRGHFVWLPRRVPAGDGADPATSGPRRAE